MRDIRSPDIHVHHDLAGQRHIERTLRNGHRIVVTPHHRYYERPYLRRGGHDYIQRTYVVRGHPYAHVYRVGYYGGVRYYGYVPAYYYRPVFYSWAYNPWPAPVYYTWAPAPWYGYYGYYWTPAPAYPSAALWLTDFLLAANLKEAYEARNQQAKLAEAQPAETREASLTPEVRAAIADEVREQLAIDRQIAGASQHMVSETQVPEALDPKQRLFIVSSNLDVVGDDGQECVLTPGDVIIRTGDQLLEGEKAAVSVQSSKRGDCARGANTQVDIADLQEMHNRFHEQLTAGMDELASKQGKGLPTPPDTSTVSSEVPSASPDSNAASAVEDQQQQADKAEQEIGQGPTLPE